MGSPRHTKIALTTIALILVGAVVYFLIPEAPEEVVVIEEPVIIEEEPVVSSRVIGSSVEGRDIEVFTAGAGSGHVLFVGGIHGGYEWNSILLAQTFIDDWLEQNAERLTNEGLTVSIIPNLNPDGLARIGIEGTFTFEDITDPATRVVEGRFNANEVDLNRNFACKWSPTSTWRREEVSAGTEAFSEPEARALRDLVLEVQPDAVVFWHSRANNVYASECHEGPLPETLTLMQAYADAGSYGAVPVFDAYPITGDAEGWLATLNIPAITVELETHDSIEWERNLAGVEAVLGYFVD